MSGSGFWKETGNLGIFGFGGPPMQGCFLQVSGGQGPTLTGLNAFRAVAHALWWPRGTGTSGRREGS